MSGRGIWEREAHKGFRVLVSGCCPGGIELPTAFHRVKVLGNRQQRAESEEEVRGSRRESGRLGGEEDRFKVLE